MKIYKVGLSDKWGVTSLAYFSTLEKAKKFKRDNSLNFKEDLYVIEIEVDKKCK